MLPTPENLFVGADHSFTCPYKSIFKGGCRCYPPLKIDLQEGTKSHPTLKTDLHGRTTARPAPTNQKKKTKKSTGLAAAAALPSRPPHHTGRGRARHRTPAMVAHDLARRRLPRSRWPHAAPRSSARRRGALQLRGHAFAATTRSVYFWKKIKI